MFFGGSEAVEVTVASENRMFALTPPHTPARVTVRVVNLDGTTTSLDEAFTYVAPIVVDAIVPGEGPATGGVPIELRGEGLLLTEAVLFEGREALDVTVLDDNTVLCILPTNPVGLADVHVVTSEGNARLIEGFRYFAPPTVTGFAPLAAPAAGGGTLSLGGTGLIEGAVVSVDGAEAEILATVPDGSKLVVRLPPGEPGPADLTVVTQYGAVTLEQAFTYLGDVAGTPALVNIWPKHGPATGGGEVTLVVTGLTDDAEVSVTMGDSPAAVTTLLPAQHAILVTAPPGVPDTFADVAVDIDGQQLALASAYRYEETLGVNSISPSAGPAGGGTDVVIRGVGFHDDIELFIGALPVTKLEVVSDTELHATTPVGSPGFADVRVRRFEREAALRDGFSFEAGVTKIYAVTPDHGAIAGNTYVRLFGTDLPPYMDVRFGGVAAPYVERLSPTEVVARSPRADEIGTVDVHVKAGPTLDVTVPQSFTYYDPTARWGGTWGDRIDGSLNVTVLTAGDDDPIEGAVVVIGHDDPPQLLGYTDDRGQVTLSSPWLSGPVDVTAAKLGSSAASIMAFDAENVTLFLFSPAQGQGPGGETLEPGTVEGSVIGLSKYLVTPPWPCEDLEPTEAGHCNECRVDADCGADAPICTSATNQGNFCTSTCDTDASCPDDYICFASADETARCVPDPGTLEGRCFVSSTSFLSPIPTADEENTIDVMVDAPTFSLTNLRLGELAVYCMAGGRRTFDPQTSEERTLFRPVVMGVARHVFVAPGRDPLTDEINPPEQVEITLDIPLSRSVNIVIGAQPLRPDGPHKTVVRAFLELGSDGYIPLLERELTPDQQELEVSGLPATLEGDLYDAEYLFHGTATADTPDRLPSSDVLRSGLGTLDKGPYLVDEGAGFDKVLSGYAGDVHDVWAPKADHAFATTRSGTVIVWNGIGWSAQPVPTGNALNAVVPDGGQGAWVVGDEGRILRWDGAGWNTFDPVTDRDLRDAHAFGPEAAIAVGAYVILEYADGAWAEVPWGPPKDLHAVWAPGAGDAWAVGADGIVLRRAAATGSWSAVNVAFYEDLHGVWGTGDGALVAVGRGGQVLIGSGDELEVVSTPTTRTLRDVWGRSADDVYAVGDAATVVHFDGTQWKVLTENTAEVSLRGIDGNTTGDRLFAMGVPAVHLDPMMKIPTYVHPAPDQSWNQTTFAYDTPPHGAEPSFDNIRMMAQTGALAWSIMAPGHLDGFELPNLGKIDGLPLPPAGTKRLIVYRVEHPGFDIDAFDSRVFSISDWRSWVLLAFSFDQTTAPPVGVDTVPGK